MPLSDDELRAVLTRAAEIQHAASNEPGSAERQQMIQAAEAAGYSRAAVERALRERFGSAAPPAVGELAFALSSDGKYHAARVLSQAPHGTRVRFLLGSEAEVAPDHIRAFSLVPGERVWVDWPAWGAWMCTVMAYDEAQSRVKLSDRWGSSRWFPVAEVWVQPPSSGSGDVSSFLGHIAMIGGSMALGAVLGSIVTALLMR